MEFLKTTRGKLVVLLVFYIPFFCALFFSAFDGMTFESPIEGCCISMERVVAVLYVLFTIWVLGPLLLISLILKVYEKYIK